MTNYVVLHHSENTWVPLKKVPARDAVAAVEEATKAMTDEDRAGTKWVAVAESHWIEVTFPPPTPAPLKAKRLSPVRKRVKQAVLPGTEATP